MDQSKKRKIIKILQVVFWVTLVIMAGLLPVSAVLIRFYMTGG